MSSPAKRRKKNDFQSSLQPVRGLDFFFNKQKQDLGVASCDKKIIGSGTLRDDTESISPNNLKNDADNDEYLARQLQEEWNREGSAVVEVADGAKDAGVHTEEDNKQEDRPVETAALVDPLETHSVQRLPHRNTETSKPATLSLQSATATEDTIIATIPFDEHPLNFNPSKYLPELQRLWAKEGGDASYNLLTRCFILVNNTQSRIKIVDTLVNLLRTIIEGDSDSLLPAVSVI